MTKRIIIYTSLLLLVASLWSEKVAVLKELNNPHFDIVVVKDQLYIPEGHQIYIYSLKNFQLINKFGKRGEGPKEFRGDVYLTIQPDHLLVESEGKISFFSKNGDYIREIICPQKARLIGLTPVGNRYVGRGSSYTDPKDKIRYNTICFYDSAFNQGSRITRTPSRFQRDGSIMFMNGTFNFKVYKNLIFVQYHGKSFKLDCFDQKGRIKYSITDKTFVNRPVSQEDRKRAYEHIKKYMPWVYRQKQRIKFPKFWGGIGTFFIDRECGRLYIITYVKKGNNETLFYRCNLNGHIINKFFFAVGDRNIWAPYPLDIEGDKLYQLRENVDREEWELHITDIKNNT
jgi:hypothetical protein